MNVSLDRVISYGADVRRLADFHRDAFGLAVVEEIEGEWAVLRAGHCELALHRAGSAFSASVAGLPSSNSNVKLVPPVDLDLSTLRTRPIERGTSTVEISLTPD